MSRGKELRSDRLDVPMRPSEKAVVKEAADKVGLTESQFTRSAALEKARLSKESTK